MEYSSSVPALDGLAVEAVEWLPSGSDAGLVRVRGRWTEPARREPELPALGLRRGEERRRFDSLPDARFGRDPAVWRATFLVPADLMDPGPEELWLSWASGAQAGLPAPARGFEPPATPAPAESEPDPGGEVIDRAVLAERRARRAESAERAQAQRTAEALKAVEVLELRSAELERRLEALQAEAEAERERQAPNSAEPDPAGPTLAESTGSARSERVDPGASEPAVPAGSERVDPGASEPAGSAGSERVDPAASESAGFAASDLLDPGASEPAEPSTAAPLSSAVSDSTAPVVSEPTAAAAPAPVEPAVSAPVEPAVSAPVEPAVSGPVEPAVSGSAEPAVSGSAEPAVSGSAEPAVSGSAEPSSVYPAGSLSPELPPSPDAPRSTIAPVGGPGVSPSLGPRPPVADPAAAPLADAVANVKRLRQELGEQRQRLRRSELLRAADAVALATFREEEGRARRLQAELNARERELAEALATAEARGAEAAAAREQVALAARRAAADADAVRKQAAQVRADLEAADRDLASERGAHSATRDRLVSRERELATMADELAGLRAELATVRAHAEQRAAELERRLSELDEALAAEQRAHGVTAGERETACAELAIAESARSAESVARAALDEELDRDRAARAMLTRALDAARSELTTALTTQSDLVLSREQARAEATRAQAELATVLERAASAESSLVAARDAAASAESSLAAARDAAASAESSLVAELASATDRALSAKAARDEAFAREESARAERAAAVERAASSDAAAAELRSQLEAARKELAVAQARISELEASGQATGGLLARIAELERAADDDLDRRAREQATAASAVEPPAGDERREVAANIDAAAAALRSRSSNASAAASPAVGSPAVGSPAVGSPVAASPVAAPPVAAPPVAAPPPAAPPPAAQPPAAPPPAASPPTAAPPPAQAPTASPSSVPPARAAPLPPARPARPKIVTEAKHPPRGDITGTSKREYPWLRGALVKLAHDDPRSATRLVLGLVPVQHALVAAPLEYDLTIRGSGTYAVSIGPNGASARSVGGPRSRDVAAFHAAADIVTLAELLAGVEKRMGRWIGSVKVHGRRGDAKVVRAALTSAGLDLAAAARTGADLDPDLVFRTFAYAIHPSWTKGHRFTVVQELAGPRPMRWYVGVRDGRPVSVERRAPQQPPDAVVSMTREAFAHLLRDEPAPSGERPTIRGDRAAVALLKAWTDRAQGRVG